MCTTHMTDLLTLRGKYAALVGEVDELKARPSLLGACKTCPVLQSELAEKNAKIVSLEEANSGSTCVAKCALCEGLEMEIANVKHGKMQTEEENTYLRTILSWVSCSEPQLGMMISQFKRAAGGSGVGLAQGVDLSAFGKIGESSGLNPSEKPNSTTTPKLTKLPSKEPVKPITKDGVFEEPPRAPPKNQVWHPKPNHLKNKLDTMPPIQEELPQKGKVIHTHSHEYQQPPLRAVRYHCDFCGRDGHLSEFCFRRKREARRAREMNNPDMYHPFHDVHAPNVQRRAPRRAARPRGPEPQVPRPRQQRAPRRDARPRGAVPQVPRPRPRRERARREPAVVGYGPRGGGFVVERFPPPRFEYRDGRSSLSGPRFPLRGDRSSRRRARNGFSANRSFEQPAQHWYSPYFTNPSVGPYAQPMSFY